MSLSVCLLTRNDEGHLATALRSVAGLADQVVVADTGSTDRTAELAASLGAEVHGFSWDDDFAAGRNFALDRATGDWVLWLNPDEELLPASHEVMRQCMSAAAVFACAVSVQEVLRADRPEAFTETVQWRLFRRRPEVRFAGRLHPDFRPPLNELARAAGMQVGTATVTLRHHAYLSKLSVEKLRWAARLLERELRDRPGQLPYLIEYGRTLLLLNDPKGHEVLAEAVEQLIPYGESPTPPLPAVQRLIDYLLNVSPEQSRSRLTAEQARDLALRWFPNTPPLLWTLAERSFRAGDFRDAAALLEQLVLCGTTGVYDRSEPFDPDIIGDMALMNLGACCTRLRQLDRAEDCFRRLLQSEALAGQAAQNLAVVYNLRAGKPPE